MNPADRARMRSVVSQAVSHALLPGARVEPSGQLSHPPETPVNAPSSEELVATFRRELEALAGIVHEVSGAEAACGRVREIARDQRATRVLSWEAQQLAAPGLLDDLESDGLQVMTEPAAGTAEARTSALAAWGQADLGLTGTDAGLAETGSIVLVSAPGRLRVASLLPPVHVALLPRARLWPTLAAWLRSEPSVSERGSNIVVISGPSRTADIEMTLSRGVHGPGEVHVVLY